MIRLVMSTMVLFKIPGIKAETFWAIFFAVSGDKMLIPVSSFTFSETDWMPLMICSWFSAIERILGEARAILKYTGRAMMMR